MKRTQLISAFLSLAALWGVQTESAAAQSAANAKPAYLDAGAQSKSGSKTPSRA